MAQRKRKPPTRSEKLLRSDGALCVTFVNSGSPRRESFDSYEDLLAWAVDTRALADPDSRRLAAFAAEHPDKAADAVRRAQTLRTVLERMFLALAADEQPAATDFGSFNAELRRAMAARELVATASGYRWSWGDIDGDDLDRLLWPVLLSAAVVLTSRNRRRVGQCQHQDCGLLFVARGGGRPRKWCDTSCRNRSSSQKHYRRNVKPQRVRHKKKQQRASQERRTDYVLSRKPSTASED